ncbi:MAG: GTPase/DUF3482 domain-containing protein [Gammaproteobacteria bacterium]|nr:GTPase/DUF3482 domain-containing protein [Gammaproteobacteria bacterium]
MTNAADTETPISIAVVGHSNTGKTSLLRTLLRDSRFGEVSASPGTTRHVEGGSILVAGSPIIDIYDTPGLEDSIGLLEAIEGFVPAGERNRLQLFLEQLPDDSPFDQEAKVIRQLLKDDLVLYVIDIREPLLGKYIDELKIIAMAAKPVIPVLNFIAEGSTRLTSWQQQLADLGLHAVVRFDTVIFNFEDERRLYLKIQAMLPGKHDRIQALIDDRQRQWREQVEAARRAIANLLIEVAAFRFSTGSNGGQSMAREKEYFHDAIRKAEQHTVGLLLGLFRFHPDDIKSEQLPIRDGYWSLDLFDRENLKTFGLSAGSYAAKGAAIGAGIDVFTGGLSLGAASALGALAGVTWGTGRRFRNELANLVTGRRFICADDNTIKILFLRQRLLYESLQHRGHAAQQQLDLASGAAGALPDHWDQWLKQARQHPEWSALNEGEDKEPAKAREKLVADIAGALE